MKKPAAKKRAPAKKVARKKLDLQLSESGNVPKAVAWQLWGDLAENQTLKPDPIPYGHVGSTIDEDGIRICGSRKFVESVLSRLKGLRRFEAYETRVGLTMQELTSRDTGKRIAGKFRVSVQVHQTAAGARTEKPAPAAPRAPRARRPSTVQELTPAPSTAEPQAWTDARAGLVQLGLKPAEAERRLAKLWPQLQPVEKENPAYLIRVALKTS